MSHAKSWAREFKSILNPSQTRKLYRAETHYRSKSLHSILHTTSKQCKQANKSQISQQFFKLLGQNIFFSNQKLMTYVTMIEEGWRGMKMNEPGFVS